MPDRVTTARLRADVSQFTRELAKASAAARAFDKSLSGGTLGDLDADLQSTSRSIRTLETDIDSLGDTSLQATHNIDRFHGAIDLNEHMREVAESAREVDRDIHAMGNTFGRQRGNLTLFGIDLGNAENRMQTITQALLAIGPAAIPAFAALGAGAVTLAGTLTFAGAAATSAVLAFTGVGDAVKALNEVAIDPSIANLQKLEEAMNELGPAAQNFAVFLNGVRDNLDVLQNTAATGLFPGLQAGIESLIPQMPLLEKIVSQVSSALGELARQGGKAIEGDEFRSFFEYLATDANQILLGMGKTLGNFIAGFAEMIQAFGPLTEDFVDGLLNMSRTFENWAAGLRTDPGFRQFVQYVEQVTPQLLDTLEALGVALIDLAKAAAPISPLALTTLRLLFEILSSFLQTPFATPLIALASALGLVSTILRVGKWVGAATVITFLKGIPEAAASATAGFKGATGSMQGFQRGLAAVNPQMRIAAGGILLLGAALTDLDEKAGLTNTANFAGIGAMLGGVKGAGIGAAIGTVFDLVQANDDLYDSIARVNEVAEETPGAIDVRTAALEDLKKRAEEAHDALENLPWWKESLGNNVFENNAQDDVIAADEAVKDATVSLENMKVALTAVANISGSGSGPVGEFTDETARLTEIATNLEPVLANMGSSFEEMTAAHEAGGATWTRFTQALQASRKELDSMAGRSDAVVSAVAGLDDVFTDAASSAGTLATALDSLVSPFLGLVAARDEFSAGLRTLDKDLASTKGSLFASGAAAEQNRAVISALVTSYIGIAEAEAEAGKGSEAMAKSLDKNRDSLVEAAVAAGIARKDIERFLEKAGLTPDLIKTIFEAQGIDEAVDEARNLADAYNKLPKQLRVDIRQDGIPQSEAGLERLKRKYDLTPKQLRIVASVQDNTRIKLDGIKARVKDVDRARAEPKIGLDTGPFDLKSARLLGNLKAIGKEKPQPEVKVATTEAERKLADAQKRLKDWDASEGEATATVDDKASPTINDAIDLLIAFDNQTATATLTTVNRTVNVAGRSATGGLVTGPGGPTSDTAGLYALSNREFVNKAASVEHYGTDFFYALNDLRADRSVLRRAIGMAEGGVPGLAKGGRPRGDRLTAGDVFRKTLNDPVLFLEEISRALGAMREEAHDVVLAERALRRERQQNRELNQRIAQAEKGDGESSRALREQQKQQAKQLEQAEKDLSRQRDELSKATSRLKEQERALLAQAQAVSDAVTASGAIFGGSGTSVTAGGVLSKLRHAAKDAIQFRNDIARLRARGLDESIIQQLLEQGTTPEGVQAVHNLAEASKSMLARINRQQGRLERVGAATGVAAVQRGGGGGDFNINFNGDISTTDVDRLARLLGKQTRKAVRIANRP